MFRCPLPFKTVTMASQVSGIISLKVDFPIRCRYFRDPYESPAKYINILRSIAIDEHIGRLINLIPNPPFSKKKKYITYWIFFISIFIEESNISFFFHNEIYNFDMEF